MNIEPIDVALEAELLKVMSYRNNFNSYSMYIDFKRLLPNTAILLKDYSKYYDYYSEHDEINWGLFYSQFAQNWHANDLTTDQIEYYRDYVFKAIQMAPNDGVNSCLVSILKKRTIENILDNINDLNPENLRTILDKFEEESSSLLQIHDKDIETIDTVDFTDLDKANGIPYFLPVLQNSLGSLVKGQFIIVSADAGTGKSAFVISQVAETLKHLKKIQDPRPILYFNSEGTTADIFGRICSNLYRDKLPGGFEEVVLKSEQVKSAFKNTFGANQLLVIQMMGSTVDLILQKIQRYNPALVIIDITDTLAPEEDVRSLKRVYDRLRLISGTYCPIIGTTQSGDTTYQDKESGEIKSRKWLGDKALYGSKTGKGGAADTIITIGKDEDNKNLRYIATPKRKRGKECHLTCELVDIYSLYKELEW